MPPHDYAVDIPVLQDKAANLSKDTFILGASLRYEPFRRLCAYLSTYQATMKGTVAGW